MQVKHEHARKLREALAHCANYGPPSLKARSVSVLQQYAQDLAPYCEHPDRSRLPAGLICLDCGARIQEEEGQ